MTPRTPAALTAAALVLLIGLVGCGRVPPADSDQAGSAPVTSPASATASPSAEPSTPSAEPPVTPSGNAPTGSTSAGSAPTTPAPTPSASSAPPGTTAPSASASAVGEVCEYTTTGTAARRVKPPTTTGVPDSGAVTVTLRMSDDLSVRFTMDRGRAPCTVHSFESLAAQRYYDKTRCHRLVDSGIFVLQCGDPTGTGSGGPGYSFADETEGTESYRAGVVAMANAGPNTNGSQFFLVYQDSPLPPNYTVFGTMDAGSIGAVNAIAYQGQDGSLGRQGGKPNNPAEIITATVSAPTGNAG